MTTQKVKIKYVALILLDSTGLEDTNKLPIKAGIPRKWLLKYLTQYWELPTTHLKETWQATRHSVLNTALGRILNKVSKVAFQELYLIPLKNVYRATDWLKAAPSSNSLGATLNRDSVRELSFTLSFTAVLKLFGLGIPSLQNYWEPSKKFCLYG